MLVKIDRFKYEVEEGEFPHHYIQEYCNLHILKEVGLYQRLLGFLKDVRVVFPSFPNLICLNTTHGGFFPIKASSFFDGVYVWNEKEGSPHTNNLQRNARKQNIKNLSLFKGYGDGSGPSSILFFENSDNLTLKHQVYIEHKKCPVLIMDCKEEDIGLFDPTTKVIRFSKSNAMFFFPEDYLAKFLEEFHYYFRHDGVFDYDNLIHLCIMVKNAGEQFESMLKDNLPVIDKWTILDTGSTDQTIDIIQRVLVGKKKGQLFQEPFINFRDSRNRLLELAGDSCVHTLMLDDTYVVMGDLRNFFETIRGDQFADSYSLFVKSDDMEYGSNRILKTYRKLKYLYKIHEVIEPTYNKNVIIPADKAYLMDRRFDYMEKRTMERKKKDLEFLYEELEDDPDNPRTHYYLGQTYNLIGDYENAFKYFKERVEHQNTGFIQERIDACFEMARIANFKLNKPWEEVYAMYMKNYEMDKSRPEAMYFIGVHHYLEKNMKLAFEYFKKAFDIGYPVHCQYSLKPTLSFFFCPKFLASLSYQEKDFDTGLKATTLFLKHNKPDADGYNEVLSWHKIYEMMSKPVIDKTPRIPEKPWFVFIADGNWNPWSGQTLQEKGLGGSETYIVEMARHLQARSIFQVVVFCNCTHDEIVVEGVIYKHLKHLHDFVFTNYIHSCMVSRHTEYVPLMYNAWVENVYMVVHDLTPTLAVFPIEYSKLRKVFCLTEWHTQFLNSQFPILNGFTTHMYYGINQSLFIPTQPKTPYRFIYSSFPDRGLLPLLQMWPQILQIQPMATLHLYCDVEHKWVNDTNPQMMQEIKTLLRSCQNIFYYGWVDKKTLAEGWKAADIWLYPCIFQETFCMTALEAAASKTLVVTNHLAALQNTVGDRGIIIEGQVDQDWQNRALALLFPILRGGNQEEKNRLIQKNFEWASSLTWDSRVDILLKDYVFQNPLEYKLSYNWTVDVPGGTKDMVGKVIGYFNQEFSNQETVRLLEIGTYTGTSILHFLNNIPKSHAVVIEDWKKQEDLQQESSFYKNLDISQLQSRMVVLKTETRKGLMDLIHGKVMFDLIFFTRGEKKTSFEFYTTLYLSWDILNKNGILGIEEVGSTDTDPKVEAIKTFLTERQGEYKILISNYLLFFQKI